MLEDPRELVARALEPLPPPPLKAPPPREELPLETLRSPMRSDPPPPAPRLSELGCCLEEAPPRSNELGCCLEEAPARLPAPDCCPAPVFCLALVCRADVDAPRVVPPNLLAVA